MVLIQCVVFSLLSVRVNQNYHNVDSTCWVPPAGPNEPKNAFSLAELTYDNDEWGGLLFSK